MKASDGMGCITKGVVPGVIETKENQIMEVVALNSQAIFSKGDDFAW